MKCRDVEMSSEITAGGQAISCLISAPVIQSQLETVTQPRTSEAMIKSDDTQTSTQFQGIQRNVGRKCFGNYL